MNIIRMALLAIMSMWRVAPQSLMSDVTIVRVMQPISVEQHKFRTPNDMQVSNQTCLKKYESDKWEDKDRIYNCYVIFFKLLYCDLCFSSWTLII